MEKRMSIKNVFKVLSVFMVVALLVGCAPVAATKAPEPPTKEPEKVVEATSAPAPTVAPAPATAVPAPVAKKIKVFGAFATPLEEPWDGVVHAAIKKASDEGKIDYTFIENIGYAGDMERVLREACEKEKPDIIIGDSYGNEEAARRVALDYPQIAFVFGSGGGPVDPNFSVFDNWLHEPGYLAGMLAAGMSKKGMIGIVAAMPVPEVNRIVNAFQDGAKEVNPKIKTSITYINNWFDPAAAKEAALAQIAQGADVLYAERFGVVDAAKEKGVWSIGMMSDQNELAPDLVLTSVEWNWTPSIEYLIKVVGAGAYTAQDLKDFSMFAKGGSLLAPYHNTESKIPAELLTKINDKAKAIKNGEFRVDINDGAPQVLK
jgi:basic membrane lipoprotein Med (substrate-binding protein (PBP1-ABC) superfamily)